MSETPELPPLPSAEFWRFRFSDWPAGSWEGSSSRPSFKGDRESGEPRVQPMFSREQVSAYGRECREAGRRAGLEEAARLTPVAPWPDFAGQPIHHGDRLRHPTGDEFIAVRLHGYAEESDAWRAIYDGESGPSRLGLQIGDKGRAVLIRAACGGTGRAKP